MSVAQKELDKKERQRVRDACARLVDDKRVSLVVSDTHLGSGISKTAGVLCLAGARRGAVQRGTGAEKQNTKDDHA